MTGGGQGTSTEKDAPDFARLGVETPYSWHAWRDAWNALSNPALWPTVVGLVERGVYAPLPAALALTRAMVPTTLTRGGSDA